ncbi:MAG: hypothetical protein M1338_03490 [Patescibacteria group bacterium]|nr:hypothetical protein [Patescibacteria group bacterium]
MLAKKIKIILFLLIFALVGSFVFAKKTFAASTECTSLSNNFLNESEAAAKHDIDIATQELAKVTGLHTVNRQAIKSSFQSHYINANKKLIQAKQDLQNYAIKSCGEENFNAMKQLFEKDLVEYENLKNEALTKKNLGVNLTDDFYNEIKDQLGQINPFSLNYQLLSGANPETVKCMDLYAQAEAAYSAAQTSIDSASAMPAASIPIWDLPTTITSESQVTPTLTALNLAEKNFNKLQDLLKTMQSQGCKDKIPTQWQDLRNRSSTIQQKYSALETKFAKRASSINQAAWDTISGKYSGDCVKNCKTSPGMIPVLGDIICQITCWINTIMIKLACWVNTIITVIPM